MPDESVRSRPDHWLILFRPDVASEIFAEGPPAVTSEQAAKEDRGHSNGEERQFQARWDRTGRGERQKKSGEKRDLHPAAQKPHRSTVFRPGVLNTLQAAAHDSPLRQERPEIHDPEDERVRPDERQRSQLSAPARQLRL